LYFPCIVSMLVVVVLDWPLSRSRDPSVIPEDGRRRCILRVGSTAQQHKSNLPPVHIEHLNDRDTPCSPRGGHRAQRGGARETCLWPRQKDNRGLDTSTPAPLTPVRGTRCSGALARGRQPFLSPSVWVAHINRREFSCPGLSPTKTLGDKPPRARQSLVVSSQPPCVTQHVLGHSLRGASGANGKLHIFVTLGASKGGVCRYACRSRAVRIGYSLPRPNLKLLVCRCHESPGEVPLGP
jgi:hypothetical protein